MECLNFLVAAALNKIFFDKMGIFRFFVAADFNNINQFLKKIGLLIFLVAAAFNQKINFSYIFPKIVKTIFVSIPNLYFVNANPIIFGFYFRIAFPS